MRAAHAALGEALGVGESDAEVVTPRIIEDSLSALGVAIANYADPESVALFRAAMAPLDLYQPENQRGGGAPAAESPEPPSRRTTR